jgi:hypothetical protein
MKKTNNTYINNLFNKILSESLDEKADEVMNRINGKNVEEIMNSPIDEGSEMCEGCGSEMTEGSSGLCEQCGSEMTEGVYEEFNEDYDEERCKYHVEKFGEEDDRNYSFL